MITRTARAGMICSVAAALFPGTAQAQLSHGTVIDILLECRKLEDTAARIACYDNIPLGQAAAAPSPVTRPAPAEIPRAGGFGSNQLPRAAAALDAEPNEISAKVSAVTERTPGTYVLTLEDGAQWQFVDATSKSYDPPRPGSTIQISSASLGSYLMRYAGQRSVRIRRTR